MKPFDGYTRSLKKLLRYILQVASFEQLDEMERILAQYIQIRREQLKQNINKKMI
ncbi:MULTISPECIES: hypothetical protein [unclassified Paenibacillus]|uniref:hypothetical protein n=1 Tax=unclassified Paenibacillus TaxID=185978 RepID=UPI001AE8BE66|nr:MULTISPECIES: hypothetical protein [unclassified Paenibacillus]MBP1154411.1 hypothetical protein [Paenibacillus sp. PvP091]MBP1170205.1 hypothetical protein [Paenibacillus sp. PvR098]MBP2441233.1 hypothetical protein [Paenibacillus sp. PvP052]